MRRDTCRGNVVIYVLIALGLLALLTSAITSQNTESNDNIDDDKAKLLAADVMSYSGTAKTVIDNMVMAGTNEASLNFVRPNQSSFSVEPYYDKVYHPEGGGLGAPTIKDDLFSYADVETASGWHVGRFNNVEWTPSGAQDIIMSAYGIDRTVCAKLNKKITGDAAIPALDAGGNAVRFFVDKDVSGITNVDFMEADCTACNGFPALCVSNGARTVWIYYNIISAQ